MLSPLTRLFRSLAPEQVLIDSTIKHDPAKPGVGYKTLPSIPEAYYCMIKGEDKAAAAGSSPHKNHAVALFRKLGLSEIPEGIWYFYDDNSGIYKLPLEHTIVLNGTQLRELTYSSSEHMWSIRARQSATKKSSDQILRFSFGGKYPYDYTSTYQIYAFRLKIDS